MTTPQSLVHLLEFLHQAEGLKTLLRHSWLSNGRQESVAEHTWRMALMAMVLAPELESENKVETGRVLKMIIIHDLAEAVAGDRPAWQTPSDDKHVLEEKGLQKIVAALPSVSAQEIFQLWQEFEEAQTPAAKFAQALDKLEASIQHNEADLATWNEKEKSIWGLEHGKAAAAYSPLLKSLKELVTAEAEQKLKE